MKKITLLMMLLCTVVFAYAIPARRLSKVVKQSDGTELTVYLSGDESFHYYRTADNIPLVREANGDFSYATLASNGHLLTTGMIAHSKEIRSSREMSFIAAEYSVGFNDRMSKAARLRKERYEAPRRKVQTIRPEGEVNVLVLLVEFADEKFSFTKDVAAQTFNGENYRNSDNPYNIETEGSLRDYFVAQSDGKFKPNFIVTDIITLDKNMEYYGGNDASGDDKNPQQMIIDACRKADANIDFSNFDNDKDGTVEFVYCLYAGYSESQGAAEETIWPHQWYLSSQKGAITLDGVKVDCYACSGELALTPEYGTYFTGIGSCCHEFSHCLGLPDFYDTSSNNPPAFGMDYWDLMDYGCYNVEGYIPIGYSAYERDFMGWRELPVLNTKGDYSMEAITAGGNGYKIVSDANPNEYYIVENRQQEGWDRYIFNSGMLITHVDYSQDAWYNNTVNNDKNHQRFTLIPADGKLTSYYTASSSDEYRESLQGDPWPGITNNTELTDTSLPAATLFAGGYMGKPITNISNKDGIVSFSFMQGGLQTPVAQDASGVTADGFTAHWEKVDDATSYILQLEKVRRGSSVLLAEDFTNLSSQNDKIENLDNYTAVPGWTGINLSTATGMLCIGSANSEGYLRTPVFSNVEFFKVSFDIKEFDKTDVYSRLTLSTIDSNGKIRNSTDYLATQDIVRHTLGVVANKDEISLQFSTEKSANGNKRLLIDNISVETDAAEYETITTVTTTDNSYTFTGLDDGAIYRYSVQAVNDGNKSDFSEYVYVTLLKTGIEEVVIESIAADAVYDLSGRRVVNPANGIYIVNGKKMYIK